MSDAIGALIAAERLPDDYRTVVEEYWRPLADEIARRTETKRPLLVGINGAQGSGKTTLCRFLELLLAEEKPSPLQGRGRSPAGAEGEGAVSLHAPLPTLSPEGERASARHCLTTATLSLDDLYLSRAARAEEAADHHPLFATRGVPGTHDAERGMAILDRLLAGKNADLPIFDKASDDRSARTRHVDGPIDVVLLEGWCVGAAPQPAADLAAPLNQLEAAEDPAGTWRREVNRRLATDYAKLFARIDLLVMLKVQDFAAVRANRRLQEAKLAASNPTGSAVMDEAALDRFLRHYQRLTEWMFAEMPARADIVLEIGRDQRPTRLSKKAHL